MADALPSWFPSKIDGIKFNPFKLLLSDAIFATHLAEENRGHIVGQTMLARSAVIHSVFVLECAANCCIADLPRSNRFRDRAEKWDALEKFDLHLLSLPHQPKLPRDHDVVTGAMSLFKQRHQYVHPRSKHYPVEMETREGKPFMTISSKEEAVIPPLPFLWTIETAKDVLTKVVAFLRLYFVELCRFDKQKIAFLLSSTTKTPEGEYISGTGEHEKLLGLALHLGLDIGFLGFTGYNKLPPPPKSI